MFTISIEIFVARLTLTEPHGLNIGDELFDLVIRRFSYFMEKLLGMRIFHAHDINKGKIIQGFGTSRGITFRKRIGPTRQNGGGI